MSPRRQPVSSETPDQAIARLAAAQHGVFTWDQALACGVTPGMLRHRIASGAWERLHRGVYRIAGAPETWRQQLQTACFAAGEGAAASHRAAAALHRLPAGQGELELTIPKGRRFKKDRVIVHESRRLPQVDVQTKDCIPVTTPARTLVDLAGVLPLAGTEDKLDAAISSGLVARPRALWRVTELAEQGRSGIRVLRELIQARAPGAEVPASVLESALRMVLAPLNLPEPAWGIWVFVGGRWRKLDVGWRDILFGIETDGWENHCGRARWEDDIERQNALVVDGWTLLRFPYRQVMDRPERVGSAIVSTMERLLRNERKQL